ncbi:hypothetical protein PAXRUDRAFT_176547, partial [Paxillus rubicundulus Ve08.2h10]
LYHPHKCFGFGLSDCEGCEHLWSSLKFLIHILLHVSGVHHHQHLFVLENQIHHLDEKLSVNFSQWLSKKWALCQQKKVVAEEALGQLEVDEGIL